MDNLNNIWTRAKDVIKNEIGPAAFDAWFQLLEIKSGENDQLIIEAPDEFFRDWLHNNYLGIIDQALRKAAGAEIHFSISINNQILEKAQNKHAKENQENRLARFQKTLQEQRFGPNPIEAAGGGISLNPKYSFNSFVIGPSNRFAHAAALAVAESPAKAYNPLFIFGGAGLGKTHLMQAIGHYAYKQNPKSKLYYIPSEQFTNELVTAIQKRTTVKFRQKYRTVDILLIDDIQFIANKEATQEEFFHTFNCLFDAHKQIVVSSDRPPKEIPSLEQRLTSRFEWGLVTDIQPPDFETRVAILRNKIEAEGTSVPDDVLNFIASNIKSNIRELEGALIRVVAYATLEKKPVNLDFAKNALKDMVKESNQNINIEYIQKIVAEYFNLKIHDLKARGRSKNLVFPRQIAMYLSREMTNYSLPELGGYFGGKDHTTVLHACNKIREMVSNNTEVDALINQLVVKIKE